MIAVGLHTIGALGKLFYEVNENVDMSADEGLRAVGGNWIERIRFGTLPQVLPNLQLRAAAPRDQRARLDHHRRRRRRRHRPGAEAGDFARLRRQDPRRWSLLLFVTILVVDQFSAWLRRRLVGEQAFLLPPVRHP